MLFKSMKYVRSLGFKVWLGEFGPIQGFSDEENKEFVLQCVNFCVDDNFGWSIWSSHNEHYMYEGFYDEVLEVSLYTTEEPVEGDNRFLLLFLILLLVFGIALMSSYPKLRSQ